MNVQNGQIGNKKEQQNAITVSRGWQTIGQCLQYVVASRMEDEAQKGPRNDGRTLTGQTGLDLLLQKGFTILKLTLLDT